MAAEKIRQVEVRTVRNIFESVVELSRNGKGEPSWSVKVFDRDVRRAARKAARIDRLVARLVRPRRRKKKVTQPPKEA